MNMVRHCSGACCKQACNLGSGWWCTNSVGSDGGDSQGAGHSGYARWWVGCSTSKAKVERMSYSPHSQGMTSDCFAVAIPTMLCHCWLTGCS